MTENSQRSRMLIAGTAITTAILLTLAAPAQADDGDKSAPPSCWLDGDTGITRCFVDEATMEAAMVRVYGALPIEEGASEPKLAARSGVTATTTYYLARLYVDSAYGGTYWPVTRTSNTFCDDGGVISSPSMQAGWNDVVSSVRGYWGCQVYLYADTSYGGASGVYSNGSTLGSLNDKTSSYKVKS